MPKSYLGAASLLEIDDIKIVWTSIFFGVNMELQYIKDLSSNQWYGEVKLYKLSEPYQYDKDKFCDHIVISAVSDPDVFETFIFPADSNEKILDWNELPGSMKNVQNVELVKAAFLELLHVPPPKLLLEMEWIDV